MTRRMADSVTPSNLPAGFDLYGGYDDGHYNNIAAIKSRYPTKTAIAFTVFPSDNFGDCLDVESGDATPAQAPAWTQMRRKAGHGGPLNYCSWAALDSLIAAYHAANVPLPGIVIAGYPAPDGDAIPVVPGVNIVAHQWIDHGPYDESIVVDYLPGIDPPPNSQPTIVPEDLFAMIASDPAFAVRFLYRFALHREVDGPSFTTDVNFLNAGGTLNELLTNIQDAPEGQAAIAAERKLLGLK